MTTTKFVTLNSQSTITALQYFPAEDALITLGEDQSLKIWPKRSNGKFWPSVSHSLQAIAKTMTCYLLGKIVHVLVGYIDGGVEEFSVNDDFNGISSIDHYFVHSMNVTNITVQNMHVFSVSQDGSIACRSPPPGKSMMVNTNLLSPGRSILVDPSFMTIVGTDSGVIEIFRVVFDQFSSATAVNRLEGHKSAVTKLEWSPESDYLVSGDSSGEIFLWDFGGRSGIFLRMTFHSSPIVLIRLLSGSKYMLTISAKGSAGLWNMKYKRQQRGEMINTHNCINCSSPFFWNLKMMVVKKVTGTRRHHCRNCYQSFCGQCCYKKVIIPKLGYESQVLVCNECFCKLMNEGIESQMTTIPLDDRSVLSACFADNKIVTSLSNRTISFWNLSNPN